jgi:hypothetical protein
MTTLATSLSFQPAVVRAGTLHAASPTARVAMNGCAALAPAAYVPCDAVPSAPMGGARNRERKAYASNHCGVKRDH